MESCECATCFHKESPRNPLLAPHLWQSFLLRQAELYSSGTGQMTYKKQPFLGITVRIKIMPGLYCSRNSLQCINFAYSTSALMLKCVLQCRLQWMLQWCYNVDAAPFAAEMVSQPWFPLWEQDNESSTFLNHSWHFSRFSSAQFNLPTGWMN